MTFQVDQEKVIKFEDLKEEDEVKFNTIFKNKLKGQRVNMLKKIIEY